MLFMEDAVLQVCWAIASAFMIALSRYFVTQRPIVIAAEMTIYTGDNSHAENKMRFDAPELSPTKNAIDQRARWDGTASASRPNDNRQRDSFESADGAMAKNPKQIGGICNAMKGLPESIPANRLLGASDVAGLGDETDGLYEAVLDVLPKGARIGSIEPSGVSNWAETAKVSVQLPDGSARDYFLKSITGQGARALAEGEFYSVTAVNNVVPQLVPKPCGWGKYKQNGTEHFFYLGDFHNMELGVAPEPEQFVKRLVELHTKGISPNGMFGFPVPTTIGKMERTVTWEKTWAKSFTDQILDDIKYDNETNGIWPQLGAASKQLIDVVIPRLLGTLQSEGRDITPVLVHGDLWEKNVGRDVNTGQTVLFDPGCTYAHNEMEFGTWRCDWARFFKTGKYLEIYKSMLPESEPAEEWDDRNRLYSIHPYLTDSAGHAGSASRQRAYNDMLFLCEKYGPLDSLEKYDPEQDTEDHVPYVISQLE